jgi:hypothetical protein
LLQEVALEATMATRAEQYRVTQEREESRKRRTEQAAEKSAKRKPKPGPGHPTRHASHATYAREPRPAEGRPSRKSTRASANRAKTDVSYNRREEAAKTSPEARERKAAARATRVR